MPLATLHRDGAVSVVTLNRPERLNAIGLPLLTDLHAALQAAQQDAGTRAIVLTGAGRAFCAGADLKDGAGEGTAADLGARHSPGGLDVAAHEPDHAAYLNWLHMSDATLTFPQTLVLRYARFEPTDRQQPQVAHDYGRWFLGRLRALEAALADGRPYLCAGRFTAADVAVGYAVMLASFIDLPQPLPGSVAAYWQQLTQRPAYARAQAAQHAAAIAQGVSPRPSPLG